MSRHQSAVRHPAPAARKRMILPRSSLSLAVSTVLAFGSFSLLAWLFGVQPG